MVDTIKFSEFADGGDLEPNQTTVGLDNTETINTRFTNPFPLLPPGTTGDRPAPAADMYYRLRFNTTLELYEYYSPTAVAWIQVDSSASILPLLASHAAGEGASLIGLENQGTIVNKFVQDLANATLLSQTDNGTLANGVFLNILPTGFMSVTTGTGALDTRVHTGTANEIDIANGDGAANPVYSLSATLDLPGTMTIQGSTVINQIIDDDTMATATDTNISTSEAIVAYIASVVGGSAGGVNGNIQYNNASAFGGDPNFNTDGAGNVDIVGSLDVDNININGNTFTATDTNGGFDFITDGTGLFNINTSTGVDGIINDPTLISATNQNLATALSIKQYVDSVASGITFLTSATAASTANYTATYDNGAAGVGATLTNSGAQAAFAVDGLTPTVGSRILIKDQTNAFENGVYYVSIEGDGSTNWELTRSPDYDEAAEIVPGTVIPINLGGTVNGGTSWLQTSDVTTVGTDPIDWIQFTATLPLSLENGGTGANITASNGGLVYSNASTFAVLAGTATANQIPLSGSNAAPAWSTATYLSTITANAILFGSSANVMGEITPAANGVLVTDGANVPSIGSTLPSAVQLNITELGTITTGVWNGTDIAVADGGTGLSATTEYAVLCGGTTATGPLQSIASVGTAGHVLTSNGAGALPTFQAGGGGGGNPVGTIIDFGGTSLPTDYLACDGSAVDRTTYATLFTAIGTTWGVGDGSTTFNLPDFRRRTAVGSGGTGTGTLGNAVGNVGGAETVALTTAQLAAHAHLYGGAQAQGFTSGNSIIATSGSIASTQNAGSGSAHNNMQPSAVVLKCIKYQ